MSQTFKNSYFIWHYTDSQGWFAWITELSFSVLSQFFQIWNIDTIHDIANASDNYLIGQLKRLKIFNKSLKFKQKFMQISCIWRIFKTFIAQHVKNCHVHYKDVHFTTCGPVTNSRWCDVTTMKIKIKVTVTQTNAVANSVLHFVAAPF